MIPKFIVDINVGSLAKKLRMLGYDASMNRNIDNDEIIHVARDEERILLTRNTGIMKRRIVTTGIIRAILIRSDRVKEQLNQVTEIFEPGPDIDPFTRCIECNEMLVRREKTDIHNLVPPYVLRTQERYMQCPCCERVYWKGTHWEKMSREIADFRG